jgi:hypothetical protein
LLQWLRTLGCPFDAARCTAEVKDAIEEVHEENIPTESYEEVLSWLRALGESHAQRRPRTRSQGRAEETPMGLC